jgi:hypothetical protein
MIEFSETALERATEDAAVVVLGGLQRVVDLALPATWANGLANHVLTPLQDAAYLSAARWHTLVGGVSGWYTLTGSRGRGN